MHLDFQQSLREQLWDKGLKEQLFPNQTIVGLSNAMDFVEYDALDTI
jgi:hypothetical protein